MTTLYIAGSHQVDSQPWSHNLGDVVTSIKVAYLWLQTEKPDKVILSLIEGEQWNPLWNRFIRESNATVVYDQKIIQKREIYFVLDERRRSREVHGIPFDVYKELYCRIDGGRRQHDLCGEERGLGRKNIFEYFYYGQESFVENPTDTDVYTNDVLDYVKTPRERRVLIAPLAKCQGNHVFTFDFWREVTQRVLDAGILVTLNDDHDRLGIYHDLCERRFSTASDIANYVARHALVVCGNTGIGWVAGATNTPLFGMEPPEFSMMDFRYKECGVQSLARLFSQPDPIVVAEAIKAFMNAQTNLSPGDLAARVPRPVTSPRKLQNMVDWLNQAPDGPVVEVGVYEGGSLVYLASRFPNRNFFGYDTFDGHPEATDKDNHHKRGDFASNYEAVNRVCSHFPNITLVKGRFPDSDTIGPTGIVLAHVDVDLYQETRNAIEYLIPRMANRSRIYDDDAWIPTCEGATIAVCECAAKIGTYPKIDHELHACIEFGS